MRQITWKRCRYIIWTLPIIPLGAMMFLVFLTAIPHACFRLPHSKCFQQGDLNYAAFLARSRARDRLKAANKYFTWALNTSHLPYEYGRGLPKLEETEAPSVVVAMLARNRNTRRLDAYEPHYLSQSLYSLTSTLDKDVSLHGRRWKNVNITICDIDDHPESFTESRRLAAMFNIVYGNRRLPSEPASTCRRDLRQLQSCLRQVMNQFPDQRFLVLAEDDMIVQWDFWTELWTLVTSKVDKMNLNNKFGYLQLHTPMEKYTYAANDASTWLEIILIAGSCTLFILFIYLRVFLRAYNILHNFVVVGFTFSLFVTVVLVVGRPHWLAGGHALTRYYRLGQPTTSGFSALLSTKQWFESFLTELRGRGCQLNMSKVAVAEGLVESVGQRVWAIYPSLFRHIGLYSDYLQDIINPHLLDD